ncbi:MAG: molybdopterin cofactor-binding domain-containing protein, partial [Salinirussus sp.]
DNVAFDWDTGDPENAADAVEQADHTVDIELEINRVLPTAVEPRAAVAEYRGGDLRVHLSSQKPHDMRSTLSDVLEVPERRLHVRREATASGKRFG